MKDIYFNSIFINKRFQLVLIIATGVFLFFGMFSQVFAVTVSPPRQELSGDPGSAINGEFKVTNETQGNAIYYTQVENFQAGDETGNPQFTGGGTGLASWVSVTSQITVPAGKQQSVPFQINIPRTAEPGGYFASIFVRTTPPSEEPGEVSIGTRLASLLLVRVNGEIRENVNILEFDTKNSQRLFASPPVDLYYRFQNTGGDRVKPVGDITVKNLFGLTSEKVNANKTEGSVLPQSIRRFDAVWGSVEEGGEAVGPKGFFGKAKHELKNFAFGYYTAELDITFGENNSKANGDVSFFLVPWHLLIIVLLVVVVVLIVLRLLLKWYKNRIIRDYQGRR